MRLSTDSVRQAVRDAIAWADQSTEEPLRLARLAIGILLLFGTAVGIGLAATGITPKALELVAVFWVIYALATGLIHGLLEPLVDGLFHLVSNVGLRRAGGGYSAIETLVAREQFAAAAEAYRDRAQEPRDRVEATLRRARLLAGPLGQAETAMVELQNLRDMRLPRPEARRVASALAALKRRRLDP